VAELAEVSIGFVGIGEFIHPEIDMHFGLISDIWIEPEFRRQGIGSLLIEYGIRMLMLKGYKRTYLQVSASNEKALALYKKKGFYEDHIVMIKNNDSDQIVTP
jgi:ribosomal protein S18 acetylase RimI-like enzyme